MKLSLDFELGRFYSVPTGGHIIHGVLKEVKVEGSIVMVKIATPQGEKWTSYQLPVKDGIK